MNRKFLSTKLEVKLIIAILISLVISVGTFFLFNTLGVYILDTYFDNTSFLEDKKNEALKDFKSFILENNISINDSTKIEKWVKDYKYIDLQIFKNSSTLLNSNEYNSYPSSEDLEYNSKPSNFFYTIKFSDTSGEIYIDSYFEYKYYYIVIFIAVIIALFSFIISMLAFINKKICYIRTLENEIKILEGGDLNYEINISGDDELSYLAESINEMRKSFIDRIENEAEAKSANSDLITAMSHDLRTPLTALVGYLDIIEYKKYKTEENLMQYIHNSREKAYQIKSLSDKLFEYFLVFNTEEELSFETFNGNELLDQLLEEEFFMLIDKNFTFDFTHCSSPFFLDVNLNSIRRVFDNIFSNISKYADASKPIKINYFIENKKLIFTAENYINKNSKSVSSTGIGLKTCSKIIQIHKGALLTEKRINTFKITLSLNIKPLNF